MKTKLLALLLFLSLPTFAQSYVFGNSVPGHDWALVNGRYHCAIVTDNGGFVQEAPVSNCLGKYGYSTVNGRNYCSIQTRDGYFVAESALSNCPIQFGWVVLNGRNYCAYVSDNGHFVAEAPVNNCIKGASPQMEVQKFALNVSFFPKETQIIPQKPVSFPVNLATGKINKCEWMENSSTSRTGYCSVCVRVESDIDRTLTLRSMLIKGIRTHDDILTFDIANDPVVESVNCKIEKVSEIKTREQIQNFGMGLGLQIQFPSAADF